MTGGMTLEEIKEATAYTLASMADCSCPDSLTSPGARMLDCVRDGVVEGIESGSITLDDFNYNGQLAEIADGAPSIYTSTIWETFVDLGAWDTDTSEWGEIPIGQGMTQCATVALYTIADHLAWQLCHAWREGWVCPVCANPRADYDCSPEDCRAWQCPECGGYDNTHGCQIDQCRAPESAGEPPVCGICGGEGNECAESCAYDTPADVVPVCDVLTGPVDLPPVGSYVPDPLWELIETAHGEEAGRRAARRARLADAAVSRFRWQVWTTVTVLAVVSVAVILRTGGVW